MTFRTTSIVPESVDDVFAWHARPGAVVRLTPPWQRVRVVAEAANLRDGTAVLRIPPGYRWHARHDPVAFVDGGRFADELTSWPAPRGLHWRHTHTFDELDDGHATRIIDAVDTNVPDRFLERMFAYRRHQLADDLAAQRRLRVGSTRPLHIAVTGAGGLVGTALCAYLSTAGHRVTRLVRRPPRHDDECRWDPARVDPSVVDGVDAVVHLAGEPIAGRFTDHHKSAVRDSRIGPTRRLAEACAQAAHGPEVFVSASAIGFYGADRGEELLTETSARGDGFLADVVADWEAAARPAADAGIRCVQVRTGIVIDPRGGMLGLLGPLFRAGVGGRLGSGRQWFSWIGIDDLCDIYARAVVDTDLEGPLDAVAPNPVRNSEFTRTLAAVLRRPAILGVPAFAPALLLGREGAAEFALANQRVEPARLAELGHTFRHTDLEANLRHLFGRPWPVPPEGAAAR